LFIYCSKLLKTHMFETLLPVYTAEGELVQPGSIIDLSEADAASLMRQGFVKIALIPMPKPEAPTPEEPKPEAPKPEAPKPEAPKPEEPKLEAPKPKEPKPKAPEAKA
jgi:outer membrane biosynthesis protein TonB